MSDRDAFERDQAEQGFGAEWLPAMQRLMRYDGRAMRSFEWAYRQLRSADRSPSTMPAAARAEFKSAAVADRDGPKRVRVIRRP